MIPTLVTASKVDRSALERLEGAETLAYLTELDVELQRKASITDHCILVLSTFFQYKQTQEDVRPDHNPRHKIHTLQIINKGFSKIEEDLLCPTNVQSARLSSWFMRPPYHI